MKAIIYKKYGPPEVLQLQEVPKPYPADNEILIHIKATTVNTGDCELRGFKFTMPKIFLPLMRLAFGVFKPRKSIPGFQFSGIVESVGKKVTRFKTGDAVFGITGLRLGSFAEYVCLPASYAITLKPDNLSFAEAAALPMAVDGLHFLRKAQLQKGEKLLILGAGGSIGTFALQIANHWGAEVTCVDSSAKLDMLRLAGAAFVMDYTQEDFTRNGCKYDVIFDVVGTSPYKESLRSLNYNGRYIIANVRKVSTIFNAYVSSLTSDKKVILELAKHTIQDLDYLKKLSTEGALKPVIDKLFPLEETVEAHRYVESGMKKGNIVITI